MVAISMTLPGLPYDIGSIHRAVFGLHLPEVSAFDVVVDCVGEIDGVTYQSSGVEEMGGNLVAHKPNYLLSTQGTMRGPMRFSTSLYFCASSPTVKTK